MFCRTGLPGRLPPPPSLFVHPCTTLYTSLYSIPLYLPVPAPVPHLPVLLPGTHRLYTTRPPLHATATRCCSPHEERSYGSSVDYGVVRDVGDRM